VQADRDSEDQVLYAERRDGDGENLASGRKKVWHVAAGPCVRHRLSRMTVNRHVTVADYILDRPIHPALECRDLFFAIQHRNVPHGRRHGHICHRGDRDDSPDIKYQEAMPSDVGVGM